MNSRWVVGILLGACSCAPSSRSPQAPTTREETRPGESPSPPPTTSPEGQSKGVQRVGTEVSDVEITKVEVFVEGFLANPSTLEERGATLVVSFGGDGPVPVATAHLDEERRIVTVEVSARDATPEGAGRRITRKLDLGPVSRIRRMADGPRSVIELDLKGPVTLELVEGTRERSVEVKMLGR